MPHGIDAYFHDLLAHRRRNAVACLLVLVAAAALEVALMPPAVVETLNDPKRFGFEGEEQYVRRILLETVADVDQPGHAARTLVAAELRRGGDGAAPARERSAGDLPGATRTGVGVGEDALDLQARLRSLALQGPVIRSEDLVVEKLVRPEYPDEARDRNIEGVVELVALVDTTGAVTEVHIVGGTHQPLLERSATDAVLQCIYRPYRVNETAERVWAYFRITFRLY